MNKPSLDRKQPAHGVVATRGGPTIIYVTVCTRSRIRWLIDNKVHRRLRSAWEQADTWSVGRYILMPDHLHLFATPRDESVSLERWVKFWKACFAKGAGQPNQKWQPSHWDVRMRHRGQYEEKHEYLKANPVRAGFVIESGQWPHQGEM